MNTKPTVAFIVNPASGGGIGSANLKAIEDHCAAIGADLAYTDPVIGASASASRFSRCTDLWVVGGDGTLGQVIQGLHDASFESFPVIHLIPAGTGNDFAHALGISDGLPRFLAPTPDQAVREVDYGLARWCEGHEWRTHAFINAMGVGLDAEVARLANKWKRRIGKSAYVAGTLSALISRRSLDVVVEVDGRRHSTTCLMAAVCNSARAGGGFALTPDASISDGRLDLCLLENVGLVRALRLLPVVKSGRHEGLEPVTIVSAVDILIECSRPVRIHLDGEVAVEPARSVVVSTVSNRARFMVPISP